MQTIPFSSPLYAALHAVALPWAEQHNIPQYQNMEFDEQECLAIELEHFVKVSAPHVHLCVAQDVGVFAAYIMYWHDINTRWAKK